jgi:metal-responsive CopG/Arc/MetJ family transcriptional regulator
MAHIRKDSSKPSTTISLEQAILEQIEDYRFNNRKNNRSEAISDLLLKGLRYVELVEKKKAKKKLEQVIV